MEEQREICTANQPAKRVEQERCLLDVLITKLMTTRLEQKKAQLSRGGGSDVKGHHSLSTTTYYATPHLEHRLEITARQAITKSKYRAICQLLN